MAMSTATFVCAVLSRVPVDELTPIAATGDSVDAHPFSHPLMIEADHIRRILATNSTDNGGLDTGAIVAIAVGSVAVLISALGLCWWIMYRQRSGGGGVAYSMDMSTQNRRSGFDGITFSEPGGEAMDGAVEMPLLRLGTSANGARAPQC